MHDIESLAIDLCTACEVLAEAECNVSVTESNAANVAKALELMQQAAVLLGFDFENQCWN